MRCHPFSAFLFISNWRALEFFPMLCQESFLLVQDLNLLEGVIHPVLHHLEGQGPRSRAFLYFSDLESQHPALNVP